MVFLGEIDKFNVVGSARLGGDSFKSWAAKQTGSEAPSTR
jgi:hypothetical protein